MSKSLRSGLIAHERKFKALILRTHPYDDTLKPFMLGDKIIQYTSFLICLRVTIDKKLPWDKDVQTAATSFTVTEFYFLIFLYQNFP